MKEQNTFFNLIRNILLVFLPALFLALLIYSFLSGRWTKPETKKTDSTPPSIMLTRDNRYFVQPGEMYEEEGYAAYDDTDGDLTKEVQVSINGDMVRYRVSDSAGNITIRFRQIPYADTPAEDSSDNTTDITEEDTADAAADETVGEEDDKTCGKTSE